MKAGRSSGDKPREERTASVSDASSDATDDEPTEPAIARERG